MKHTFSMAFYVYYLHVYYLLMISLSFKLYIFLRHCKYVKISVDSFFSHVSILDHQFHH